MITVSSTFTENTKGQIRRPVFEFSVDWTNQDIFQEESDLVRSIEIEKVQNEPFGGITLAQADVVLINHNNKFTPVE